MVASLFFTNLKAEQVQYLQSLAQETNVQCIAKLIQEKRPDWNAIIEGCQGKSASLLALQFLDLEKVSPKVKDRLIITGLIFLKNKVKDPNAEITYFDGITTEGTNKSRWDFTEVSESQRFGIRYLDTSKRTGDLMRFFDPSCEAILNDKKVKEADIQFLVGLADRKLMIELLDKNIHVVSIPGLEDELWFHGGPHNITYSILHDESHIYFRMLLLEDIGMEQFRILNQYAEFFEDAHSQIDISLNINQFTVEPLLKTKGDLMTQIKHLLDLTAGTIVDGFKDILVNVNALKPINESDLRIMLKNRFKKMLDQYHHENIGIANGDHSLFNDPTFDVRLASPNDFDPNLVEKTISWLKTKGFIKNLKSSL